MTQNTKSDATNNEFPHFVEQRHASCFRCGNRLADLSSTSNAPGRGHFRGHCDVCGIYTWYDCAEGPGEMIRVNEGRNRWAAIGFTPECMGGNNFALTRYRADGLCVMVGAGHDGQPEHECPGAHTVQWIVDVIGPDGDHLSEDVFDNEDEAVRYAVGAVAS